MRMVAQSVLRDEAAARHDSSGPAGIPADMRAAGSNATRPQAVTPIGGRVATEHRYSRAHAPVRHGGRRRSGGRPTCARVRARSVIHRDGEVGDAQCAPVRQQLPACSYYVSASQSVATSESATDATAATAAVVQAVTSVGRKKR